MSEALDRATAQVVAALEAQVSRATGQWQMPWHRLSASGVPTNAATGKAYTGGNVFVLWAASMAAGYRSPRWATYKQWSALGGQVRKGERGTFCVRWQQASCKEHGKECRECDRPLFPSGFTVFNVEQVDGVEQPEVQAIPVLADVRDERLDAFFQSVGATIIEGGDRAFYRPSTDEVHVPEFSSFKSGVAFWGTLAHEVVHWTGAESRLNRAKGARFGDETYAFEELVAELGAALLCARLGVEAEPREDHAEYLASWLKVLKADSRALWTAASHAQKAVDLIEKEAAC